MAFVRTSTGSASYATPEELYRDLPRRPGAVPGLWSHQADILRTYVEHAERPDVALELPTGTGKTLTGLLIAEWRRRSRKVRTVYACPTRQLVSQVAEAAHREGIDVAVLMGGHETWENTDDNDRYESASRVAVTTYNTIFNARPYIADADLMIFDDAHAGEQYVGEKYAVKVERQHQWELYNAVLEVVAPALDGVCLARMRAAQPDTGCLELLRLVVPLRQPGMVERLGAALGMAGSHRFDYSMIRSGLASCLVYIAYTGILIRPYLPPTHQNKVFVGARQRLYLSATLGRGGELERAFGRSGITKLGLPPGVAAPRYGRRFFVFPEFVEDTDAEALARDVVAEAGKALVLAPSTATAMRDAEALAQPGWPVLGLKQVENGMEPFAALPNGTCGLAARYDGLDLPGDACKAVALDGVPSQENLQERFLTIRVRAGAALAERVRTRIVQGAGRCTRSPRDTAIVLVLSPGLSRYLGRPEVVGALDPELQAEIRFGRENSQDRPIGDVLSNVKAFLAQDGDDAWRDVAEPILTDYRREAEQRMPSGTVELQSVVSDEIQAWAAAHVGDWAKAALHAGEVARIVGAGGHSTGGYRSFWLYLQAAWADKAADDAGDGVGRASAQAKAQQAEQILGLGSWVREMAPFPAATGSPLAAPDAIAVLTIAARLEAGVKIGRVQEQLQQMKQDLAERRPSKYEPALTQLGTFIGAEASKPPGNGRCDSTWCWGNDLWLAMEAKSDHEPSGVVPHKDIRQANDQLRLLASDRAVDAPPPASAAIIVSPKPGIHEDGIKSALSHVHMVSPDLVVEIAEDVVRAWDACMANRTGRSIDELRSVVAEAFENRGILPSQLLERLTREPVGSQG